MFIIRPIQKEDLQDFISLAFKAKIGITSLPKNEAKLRELMQISINSFASNISSPGQEIYLFVLENVSSNTICGVCGIYAQTGGNHAINYFKILSFPLEKKFPEVPDTIEILEPINYSKGPTEVCSLFLDPDYRNEGLGKLLSFSRFLFMANFPERFSETIFALMRSYIDDNDENPFWNNVGRKFLNVSFKTLMERMDEGKDIFPPMLNKVFILVPLLEDEAKKAIGHVYRNTLPALHMLKKQNFSFNGEIDAIDGGPKIEAKRDNITAIKESKVAQVSGIENINDPAKYLISNCMIHFRCCIGSLRKEMDDIVLSKESAELLQVKIGDQIRYIEV